ncbi:type 2 lantipeptide synthetase LanM, partial [Halobacteriales archaeon QS_1_68_20]
AIRHPTWPADEPLPDWLERLEVIVGAVQDRDPGPFDGTADDPFAHVFDAVAAVARDRLDATAVEAVLSPAAIDDLEAWLSERLVTAFTRVLYVEFKTFVALRDEDRAFADPDEFDGRPPTTYYERFVTELFEGRLADLCVDYPVFGRLLATRVRQWVEATTEFARRLDDDQWRLREQFGGKLGDVVGVEPLADDTHGDGRAVLGVRFESGASVVYKPRPVDAAVAFYEVLDRFGDRLPADPIETPAVLPADGYGWMERVDHRPCPDEATVDAYYRRAGAVLCLAYLLGVTDCHHENLIARGSHPTLVDLETVLHPVVPPERKPLDTALGGFVDESVLLTGLVPWAADAAGRDRDDPGAVDRSGLGTDATELELEAYERPRVAAVNTDLMTVEYAHPTVDTTDSTPSLDGEPRLPQDHVDALVEGFGATYDAVADDPSDLLSAFEPAEHRFVFRATRRYGTVISALQSRRCLQDGAWFTIELESLAAPFFDGTVTDDGLWDLYELERTALKRLDPPRLTTGPDDAGLRLATGEPGPRPEESGLAAVRRRLDRVGEHDRRRQVRLLRGGYETLSDDDPHAGGGRPTGATTATARDPAGRPDEDRFRHEAAALLDRVWATGFAVDGRPHWVSLGPDPEPGLRLLATDASLFQGRCGIALPAAGHYRLTGDETSRLRALDAVAPLLDGPPSADRTDAELGGAVGPGSVAYSLGVLGDLLDAEDLVERALAVAAMLEGDWIADDDEYDVIGGAAGTVLALLGLHDRTGEADLVSTAVQCGDHLLDARVETSAGPRAWPADRTSRPQTGFAHGAAGIAYALHRLGRVAGEQRFVDAAIEAVRYERAVYDDDERNWPDFRQRVTDPYHDRWCHGRSGIGLARVGMLDYGAPDLVRKDAERAVTGMRTDRLAPKDHLCCGNAGRIEFLLAASRLLEVDQASDLAARVLARKADAGHFGAMGHSPEVVNPTFFWGLSGIAYTLLRLTAPDELPCVLLWR